MPARARAAEGRGERRREGTRAHCGVRPALCPSLAADGLSRCPQAVLLPQVRGRARRLTHAPRTPELAFPRCSERAGRREPELPQGAAGLGPLSQAPWVHAGAHHVRRGSLARAGRSWEGLPGVGVWSRGSEFTWVLRWKPVWPGVGCCGVGAGWSQRVGTAFGPANSWGTAYLPLTLLGHPDGKTLGAARSGQGRRPQLRGLACCTDAAAPSGYVKTF